MKKQAQKSGPVRSLSTRELARARGGVTANDDWEAPLVEPPPPPPGNKMWTDDWLAPR